MPPGWLPPRRLPGRKLTALAHDRARKMLFITTACYETRLGRQHARPARRGRRPARRSRDPASSLAAKNREGNHGPTSAPPASRDLRARAVQEARAGREEAPPGGGAHDLGPARHRQAPDPEGRLRLHRRRRRGGDLAGPRPAGVPGHRVPPLDPARRRRSRHQLRDLRRPLGPAVRHRPDRLHPPDADRGRDRGCLRGGSGRHPLLPLDPRHHLDRGRQGRQPGRPQLVPALCHA